MTWTVYQNDKPITVRPTHDTKEEADERAKEVRTVSINLTTDVRKD